MSRQSIVVGIDGTSDDEFALGWSVREAASRHAPVELVYAFRYPPTAKPSAAGRTVPFYATSLVGYPREVAEQVVATAIERARELDPAVSVTGQAIEGRPASVLLAASKSAAILVLGSHRAGSLTSVLLGSVSSAVAARPHCPTVVLRGPEGLPEEDPGIVVGLDGHDGDQTLLAFAFDQASRHGCRLEAVYCWHPHTLVSGGWRIAPTGNERAHVWLSDALAAWREKYPDVPVHELSMGSRPTEGLVAESLNQRLLVVGTHGPHARPGTLLGSVSQGALHHALCPVAVVPTHDRVTQTPG